MARRPADAEAQGWLPNELWLDIDPVSLQAKEASAGPLCCMRKDLDAHRMCLIVTLQTLVLQCRLSVSAGLVW